MRPTASAIPPTSGCFAMSGTARSRSAPLTALVDGVMRQQEPEEETHPLAEVPEQVDGEELARMLEGVEEEMQQKSLNLSRTWRLCASVWATSPTAPPGLATSGSASICSTASPRCCKNCVEGPPPRPKTEFRNNYVAKKPPSFRQGHKGQMADLVCRLVILDRSIGECRIILRGR